MSTNSCQGVSTKRREVMGQGQYLEGDYGLRKNFINFLDEK